MYPLGTVVPLTQAQHPEVPPHHGHWYAYEPPAGHDCHEPDEAEFITLELTVTVSITSSPPCRISDFRSLP